MGAGAVNKDVSWWGLGWAMWKGLSSPSSIPERGLKAKGKKGRVERGQKTRVGGHLVPKNPGV